MKNRENELYFISVVLDLVLLNIAVLCLSFLFHDVIFQQREDLFLSFLLTNFSWIFTSLMFPKKSFYLKKSYIPRLKRMLTRVGIYLLVATTVFFALFALTAHLWWFLLAASGVFFVLKLISNFLYYLLVKHQYKKSRRVKRALLLGDNDTMRNIRKIIKSNPQLNYRFVGYLSEDTGNKRVLGTCADFDRVVAEQNIHVVFAALELADKLKGTSAPHDQLLIKCNQLGVRLFYVPEADIPDAQLARKTIKLNGINIINPQKIPMDLIENQIKKRAFDLVFSTLVIVFLLSWLYPLIGLLIKLSSRGPVLFKQQRTGVNKLTFYCYKFRSMQMNREADLKQSEEDDPRITAIGRFIRCTNIDELPQFFNVFKGDMSVVGPRPHMLAHTEQYSSLVKEYLVRHYVKPGITGWAQINGYRGETDELWKMEKRVEYDKFYINHWHLYWDVVIVWKTIFEKKAFLNAR